MPVDNEVYNQMADSWWDEGGFLHALIGINPARFGYMKNVLAKLGMDPRGKETLDIGCGGGLLSEEFARLGCNVTGIDPSEKSLEVARAHAASMGLSIAYETGQGEALLFDDETFDIAYCCDVLEHVNDLRRVIAETARVLKPGAVFLYNTINRTFQSKLIVIKLYQEWSWFSFMTPGLHDWEMFIKPEELASLLSEHGLESKGLKGIQPKANLFTTLRVLRALKRRKISYLEAYRRVGLSESDDVSVMYMGHALKR